MIDKMLIKYAKVDQTRSIDQTQTNSCLKNRIKSNHFTAIKKTHTHR